MLKACLWRLSNVKGGTERERERERSSQDPEKRWVLNLRLKPSMLSTFRMLSGRLFQSWKQRVFFFKAASNFLFFYFLGVVVVFVESRNLDCVEDRKERQCRLIWSHQLSRMHVNTGMSVLLVINTSADG